MSTIKLSTIIALGDDVKWHAQEYGQPWLTTKYLLEHLTKHHKAHKKLVKTLLELREGANLEIDV